MDWVIHIGWLKYLFTLAALLVLPWARIGLAPLALGASPLALGYQRAPYGVADEAWLLVAVDMEREAGDANDGGHAWQRQTPEMGAE